MRNGVYTGAKLGDYVGGDRRDFVGARAVVNGSDRASDIAGYAEGYLAKVPGLKGGTQATTVPKVASVPASTEGFKGKKLTVTIGENVFTFYHQGTRHTSDGLTTLTGQGIRWVLNRRPRNKSRQQTSLKALAQEIVTAHGFTLDYQSPLDPAYEYVAQQGVSDYQWLVKEARNSGLWVGEQGTTLTIKDLQGLADTQLVLTPGNNLISYTIADLPLDGSKEDGSSLAPNSTKAVVSPTSGGLTPKMPDVDPAKSMDVTGKPDEPKGTLKPGVDAAVKTSASRYKRVKGLPSSFVVPMSQDTLDLQPMTVVRTKGLPGVLSRAWVVDKVTHQLPEGITTLEVYSPIEVLDLSPQTPSAPGIPTNVALKPGGFIVSCHGPITSPVGDRVHPVTGAARFHAGTDIGIPEGTPLVASIEGTVKVYGFDDGGYGNYFEILADNGWSTLYAHLDQILVKTGQRVKQGEKVALSGATGIGTGAHLHQEIRQGDQVKRPEDVGLPGQVGQSW